MMLVFLMNIYAGIELVLIAGSVYRWAEGIIYIHIYNEVIKFRSPCEWENLFIPSR
jgi:hypothetical protein